MKVKELIAELSKLDPNALVLTWDAYDDTSTDSVVVTPHDDGTVTIAYIEI